LILTVDHAVRLVIAGGLKSIIVNAKDCLAKFLKEMVCGGLQVHREFLIHPIMS